MSFAGALVVTRHRGLVEYLREQGIIGDDAIILAHATAAEIRGRHVIGVLPLHLARECDRVTEIPLNLPPDLRGVELSVEQVRQYAGKPIHYLVVGIDDLCADDGVTLTTGGCAGLDEIEDAREVGWARRGLPASESPMGWRNEALRVALDSKKKGSES